jgi:hypothetical protein
MLSSPFMWPSPLSAVPRLKRCFASVVLPSVKFHERVDVFVGCYTRPSQARRFDALQRPLRTHITNAFCASCEAKYRERIEASGVGSSLFASESNSSRFKQGSIISHISCFTHNLVMRITSLCASIEFAFRSL